MAATKYMISKWFDRGIKQKATHMIVVCDTFDYEDYPVYVSQNENVHDKQKDYDGKNMQKVMEVYDLSKNKQIQLDQDRVYNY